MKNKYLLIKMAGVGFLILLATVYLLVYFFPALETINGYRRQLKDLNLNISHMLDTEKRFAFPNDQELEYFQHAQKELRRRMPEIQGREEYFRHFTQVFDYIKTRARQDGIQNLVVNTTSNELELNATSLHTDARSLERLLTFTSAQLSEMQKQLQLSVIPVTPTDNAPAPVSAASPVTPPIIPHLSFQSVYLSFSGDMKQALTFLNHLPWGDFYLRPADIIISAGPETPFYMVFLKVYYLDMRPVGKKSHEQ